MTSDADIDLMTVGEAMILVTPRDTFPLQTAAGFVLETAGAEANVASHIAALGGSSAWVGRLGDDPLGHRIATELSTRGVDTHWIQYTDSARTGVYFKDPGAGVYYYRDASAAARAEPHAFDQVPFEQARIVHVTGITPALSTNCSQQIDDIVARVARSGSTLSFDVNFRPQLWGRSSVDAAGIRLREIAQAADIVFVGLDEAQVLWNVRTAADIRALLPSPKIIVVKDGGAVAYEDYAGRITEVAAFPVDVVEVVGAGDAFAAGYLMAYLEGDDAPDRLRRGHERAVLTLLDTADFPRALDETRTS